MAFFIILKVDNCSAKDRKFLKSLADEVNGCFENK
jgi:hypothetical protein